MYQYSKINQQGTIRLMLLQPSVDLNAVIKCSLIDATVEDCDYDITEHFVALSYVWGDSMNRSEMLVEGKRLSITASLDYALRHIRDNHRVLRAWADGICINQNSIEDCNQQVSLMRSIYSTARHKIIFLCPSSSECDSIMEYIQARNPKLYYSEQDPADSPEGLSAGQFEAVVEDSNLTRPWFTRAWVLQEFILSMDPWIQCGKLRVRWDPFYKHVLSKESSYWKENSRNLPTDINEAGAKFNNPRSEYMEEKGIIDQLSDILQLRRGCGVSDPGDMVFAHLGLIKGFTHDTIPVSYEISTAQLYEDIARGYISNKQNATILSLVEDLESCDRRGGFPSWVPDWTAPFSANRNNEKSEVFSICVPHICALAGWNRGCIKSILLESTLPLSSPDNEIGKKLFPEWMATTDLEIQQTRQFVFQYYKTTIIRNRGAIDTQKGWTVLCSSIQLNSTMPQRLARADDYTEVAKTMPVWIGPRFRI